MMRISDVDCTFEIDAPDHVIQLYDAVALKDANGKVAMWRVTSIVHVLDGKWSTIIEVERINNAAMRVGLALGAP